MQVTIVYDSIFRHAPYKNISLACANRIRSEVKGDGKLTMRIKDELLTQAPNDYTSPVKKKEEGKFDVTVKVKSSLNDERTTAVPIEDFKARLTAATDTIIEALKRELLLPFGEKMSGSAALIDLGYRDYIAARFLLNNEMVVQGLTLASTAVEKYLKGLLVLNLDYRIRFDFHFDKLEKLQEVLAQNYYDVTKEFDLAFVSILEKSFKIRYYDRIKLPITIGFYLNQFIGELDHTIDSLEKKLSPMTAYKQAVKNKEPKLFENNYVLNKMNKKEFIERPDTGFSIYIDMGPITQRENVVVGREICNEYEGRMSVYEDPFRFKWEVNN